MKKYVRRHKHRHGHHSGDQRPRNYSYDYHPTYSYNFYMPPGYYYDDTYEYEHEHPHPHPHTHAHPHPHQHPHPKHRYEEDNTGNPRYFHTSMFPPYMGYDNPSYPHYRPPPHQQGHSHPSDEYSIEDYHFSMSRSHRKQNTTESHDHMGRRLVNIDEQRPLHSGREARETRHDNTRHDNARHDNEREIREHYKRIRQAPSSHSGGSERTESPERPDPLLNFAPGLINVSAANMRKSLIGVSPVSHEPVKSPVAEIESGDENFLNALANDLHPVDDSSDMDSRERPAVIVKEIEAARQKYGHGIKADRQVKEYLKRKLHLNDIKNAGIYLRLYDKDHLGRLSEPHHPAPSKPPPQLPSRSGSAHPHLRHITDSSAHLSEHLYSLDDELLSGDGFVLHSEASDTHSHDAREWHTDKTAVAAKWKVESVVETYDVEEAKWVPAHVVSEFEHDGEKWLGLDVAVHGDKHIYKEVQRFGESVRSLGVTQLEDGTVLSDMIPHKDLLYLHGILPQPKHVIRQVSSAKQQEVILHAEGAGSEIINGIYVYQKEGVYAHKHHHNIQLQHDMENHMWMFLCTNDHHNYYFAMGDDESNIPPLKDYEFVDGKPDPPIVSVYKTDHHEEIESSSEADSEFDPGDDYFELTFKLRGVEDVEGLEVEFSHTPNERHLLFWHVKEGGMGYNNGLRSQDILHTLNQRAYHESHELQEAMENVDFPCTVTVLRHRNTVPIIHISGCGVEAVNGTYSIAGVSKNNNELLFVQDENPAFQIYSGDHHNWIIGSLEEGVEKEYYMVNIDEELPPSSGWRICEHGVKPKPSIKITKERISLPDPPVITAVVSGDGCATVEFDFDNSQLIPECAPRVKWWYKLEGRHCSTVGYDNRLTVKGLKNGEDYQFVVKAESQVTRTVSRLSEVVTPLKTPTAEWARSGNHFGVKGGDGTVELFFDDEGLSLNDVRASYFIDVNGLEEPLSLSPHKLTDLKNGKKYTLTLIAKNDVGQTRSVPLSITPLLPPNVPTISYIDDEHTDALLLQYQCLHYKDPDYDAYMYVKTIPETPHIAPTKARPIKLDNLVTGQPYQFQLVAMNTTASVEGPIYSQTVTPLFAPSQPEIVRVEPGMACARVFFDCSFLCTPEFAPTFFIHTDPPTAAVQLAPGDRIGVVKGLANGTRYTLTVTAENDRGEVASEPSKPFYPLELPPAVKAFHVEKHKKYLKLKWDSEDVTDLRYQAEFLLWSEPSTGHVVRTARQTHNFANLRDDVEYTFFVQTINAVGKSEVLRSEPISIHHKDIVIGSGVFGIEEMARKLDNRKELCALFVLELYSKRLLIRLDFLGKGAPKSVERGRDHMNEILGEPDVHLSHFFDDKRDVNAQNIIDLCLGRLQDDPEIAGKKLSVAKLVENYQDSMFERKERHRTGRSGEHHDQARLEEILELLRDPHGFVNWAIFAADQEQLTLLSADSFGSFSLVELCDFVKNNEPDEGLALLAIEGSFHLIQFTADHFTPIAELAEKLQPYGQLIHIEGLHKMTEDFILQRLKVDFDHFSDWLEAHTHEHPQETQILQADEITEDFTEGDSSLPSIIKKVKSRASELNWVLVDPSDCADP